MISSVLPSPLTTGGEIVLHRHFVERSGFDFKVITIPILKPWLFRFLERSPIRKYIKALQSFYEYIDLAALNTLPRPLFVLTVAHGRACYAAQRAAQQWKVPLITIFHDWFPASNDVHQDLRQFSDLEFKRLYRQSALAFCVSAQMKEALGPHHNAVVLPPMPSDTSHPMVGKRKEVPMLFYSGFCGGAYFNMLSRFLEASRQRKFTVQVSGSEAKKLHSADTDKVTIHGFLPEDQFQEVFAHADILLVFLDFNPKKRKHFSTHFPSKLVEYCGKGKLIAIWGPGHSTAVQWAKETQGAFYYETNDVDQFIDNLLEVYYEDEKRDSYVKNAWQYYQQHFAPDVLDKQLRTEIQKVLEQNTL